MALSLVAACFAASASAAIPSWTAYHRDTQRAAVDPDTASTTLTAAPPLAWQSSDLDGKVNAEPLLYGNHVYVATENDTVYSLNAVTGAVEWQAHVGTPVPRSALPTQYDGSPCGDIAPEGIVSTPVIDTATNTLFAVAFNWDGSNAEHRLVGIDLQSGQLRPGFPLRVEPSYPSDSSVTPNGPVHQYQRAALALDGSDVVIGFGSNDDCTYWWGWLMSAPKDGNRGTAAERTYQVESQSGHSGGGIWGAGNGPFVDAAGNIFTATGNGEGPATYDYQSSVLKLDPSLHLIDSFAPSNWATLDAADVDVGSSAPLPLPGGLLFQAGKAGVGHLLSAASLNGIGGDRFSATICDPAQDGQPPGEVFGGGVYLPSTATTGRLFVACHYGLRAIDVNTSVPSFTVVNPWNRISLANGPPIFAAGLVWSVGWDNSQLYGIDPNNGNQVADVDLGSVPHFTTPTAGGGRLFVAAKNAATGQPDIRAYTIGTPASSVTSTTLRSSVSPAPARQSVAFTASVNPIPYGGTVGFTDGPATISGCEAVPVDATGNAVCTTSYDRRGSHQIGASYSGDAFYTGSHSPTLTERVLAPPSLTHVRLARKAFRAKPGTNLRFDLSDPAAVTFFVYQRAHGRLFRGHCSVGRKHGSLCARVAVRLRLRFAGVSGANTFTLRTSSLRPGRYRASVTAQDADGSSSASVTLTFVVLAAQKSPRR